MALRNITDRSHRINCLVGIYWSLVHKGALAETLAAAYGERAFAIVPRSYSLPCRAAELEAHMRHTPVRQCTCAAALCARPMSPSCYMAPPVAGAHVTAWCSCWVGADCRRPHCCSGRLRRARVRLCGC